MLDQMFAEAATHQPAASPDLTERVLADAMAAQPVGVGRLPVARGWWSNLLSAIGGVPGAGGLVAASIVGLWIGVSPPEVLPINAAGLWDYFEADLTVSWASYGDIL